MAKDEKSTPAAPDAQKTTSASASKTTTSASKPAAAATKTAGAKKAAAPPATQADETPEEKAAKAKEAMQKAEAAIRAAEKAERDAKEAAAKAAAAKADAEAAAEAEYKAIAAQVKADTAKKNTYTYKRQSEEIFRRDMGEPEFFLEKKERFPRPILTPQQQESLTRHAETPQDQTPQYVPKNVLSPEFEGLTNYERGVGSYLDELRAKLAALRRDPDSSKSEILKVQSDIAYLESIHENYYIGMNVFRTAKGGRTKGA